MIQQLFFGGEHANNFQGGDFSWKKNWGKWDSSRQSNHHLGYIYIFKYIYILYTFFGTLFRHQPCKSKFLYDDTYVP